MWFDDWLDCWLITELYYELINKSKVWLFLDILAHRARSRTTSSAAFPVTSTSSNGAAFKFDASVIVIPSCGKIDRKKCRGWRWLHRSGIGAKFPPASAAPYATPQLPTTSTSAGKEHFFLMEIGFVQRIWRVMDLLHLKATTWNAWNTSDSAASDSRAARSDYPQDWDRIRIQRPRASERGRHAQIHQRRAIRPAAARFGRSRGRRRTGRRRIQGRPHTRSVSWFKCILIKSHVMYGNVRMEEN